VLGELVWVPEAKVYVMVSEVTQAAWRQVMGNAPSAGPACGTCPVESVTWHDAVAFAEKLSLAEGASYRLLSNAEWTAAARAGEDHPFAGAPDAASVAWTKENAGGRPHEACRLAPNRGGLCDLSGNVAEWTLDESQGLKGTRGGSWAFGSHQALLDHLGWAAPTFRSPYQGFRLARLP
jgi:formylglycine-generating enzyme required for sulfatase activity